MDGRDWVECQVLGKAFWRRSRQTREEQGEGHSK